VRLLRKTRPSRDGSCRFNPCPSRQRLGGEIIINPLATFSADSISRAMRARLLLVKRASAYGSTPSTPRSFSSPDPFRPGSEGRVTSSKLNQSPARFFSRALSLSFFAGSENTVTSSRRFDSVPLHQRGGSSVVEQKPPGPLVRCGLFRVRGSPAISATVSRRFRAIPLCQFWRGTNKIRRPSWPNSVFFHFFRAKPPCQTR